jgi:8-oxo-dGTP pyrophosphatase MutT (NUDIX family)
MELKVGVKILLKNKEGKHLILKRSAEKYPEAGSDLWDIAGGRIEPGSTLIDNLKREVLEETGLELIGEPSLVHAQDILRITGKHVVRLTYIGEGDGEVILSDEHDDYKWLTFEEIIALEGLDNYLKEVLEKKLL